MHRGIAAALFVFLAAAPAAAQVRRPITVAQALDEARTSAPAVVVSAAQAAVAARDVDVAGILPNPTIGVGTTSASTSFVGTFFVSLPIFGQRETGVDAANAQARVARAGVEVARLDAALAASTAWTELWLAQERLGLGEQDVAQRERLADAATARFDDGAGPRLDVLRATADLRRATAEQEALTTLRDAAAARLAGLLGRQAGEEGLVPDGDPIDGERAPTLSELASLLASHPLLRRSEAAVAAADAAVEHAHRSRWPDLGLSVQDWLGRQSGVHDIRVVLSMQIPIFDEPRISRAETARGAIGTEDDALRTELRAALVAARADYIASVRRSRAETSDVLPAAEEAAELSAEAYRSGGLDLTGALSAEQALSAARLRALVARAERAMAYARLQHAAGRAP